MRVVRDRGDARWLPSRFHFALFRLLAYIRLRMAKPEPKPGVVMAVQRDQSAFETFLVSISILIVGTALAATWLASRMSYPAAVVLGFIVTATYIQIQVVGTGALLMLMVRRVSGPSNEKRITINSAILMLLAIAAAALLAIGDSPVRHIGTAFLVAVAVNALCTLLVFAMERPIAEAERRFGVES